jgi:copper(I)-binding protein
VVIESIRSASATGGMLHYDVNICAAGTTMMHLASVTIRPHHSLRLSLRGDGAMLSGVRQGFKIKEAVTLAVAWRNDHHLMSTLVIAVVVRRPAHLHFGLHSSGSMPGMHM